MRSKRIIILFAILLSAGFITPSFAEEYIEYDYSGIPSLIIIPNTTTLIITNDDISNDHRMKSNVFDTGLIQYGVKINISGSGLSGDYSWSDPITGHSGIIRVTGENTQSPPVITSTPISTTSIQPTTSEDIQVVLDQTQVFKEAIESKISSQVSAQIEPLIAEITELKAENLELKSQLEKFKQLYADWRAVAMEQLKVMSDILGLF
jgi:hypothetical protein